MEGYIFDGEPHALNEEFAYILEKVDPNKEGFNIKEECIKFYRKYSEYLLTNDKEKVIELMMRVFEHHLTFDEEVPDTSWTYRPPYLCGPVELYGTFALKFKRAPEDTLVNL